MKHFLQLAMTALTISLWFIYCNVPRLNACDSPFFLLAVVVSILTIFMSFAFGIFEMEQK